MSKNYLTIACYLGALTVAMGAFGAHALKAMVDEHSLAIYDTAIRYQFFHTLALALTGLIAKTNGHKLIKSAGLFFMLGILFFSGSLYLLTLKAAIGAEGFLWVGPITPIGGLFFIVGWILLGVGTRKSA
jgi:uncharacterized membrane protein YgdD (TMEM256/DUF423 family)